MNRLLPIEMIPSSLWNPEQSVLYLPPDLISNWETLLKKHGLHEKARKIAPEGFEGGKSKIDTDNHFAWRFSGSCARVMLAMLDPKEEILEISNVFVRLFCGNKVFLADLPCGCGAASISILTTICELRKQNRLPRIPLHVVIVGGEISEFARQYFVEGISGLMQAFEEQAITLEFEAIDWDVCDPFSNSDLVRHLTLKSQDCASKLLVLANFSGFLQKDGKWSKAQKQFDELFRHSRQEKSIALWIEPSRNNVLKQGGFMPRILKWFKDLFSSIILSDELAKKSFLQSNADTKHPLIKGTFRTNLVVIRFDLPLRRVS